MPPFIRTVGTLSISLLLLLAGCAPTQTSLPSRIQSESPELDDRVKIEFGHWHGLPDYSMGRGPVFLWYGKRTASEQEFCFAVEEACQSPAFRPELLIATDNAMDMPFHEFIERLGHLQALCRGHVPPDSTFTLRFKIVEYSSPATSSSPVPNRTFE
jgi:hypothetical protein